MSPKPSQIGGGLIRELFRLEYAHTTALVHAALTTKDQERMSALLDQAQTEAQGILKRSAALLGRRFAVAPPIDKADVAFLEGALVPATDVLLAGIEIERASLTGEFGSVMEAAARMQELNLPLLSFRVAYNLACFWSSFASKTTSKGVELPLAQDPLAYALKSLERALRSAPETRRGNLARWAIVDPSLSMVRQHRSTARQVDRLLSRFALLEAAPNSKRGLADLVGIGPDGAAALARVGVTEPGNWIPQKMVQQLALFVEVPREVFQRWVDLVALAGTASIGARDVNLLVSVGVDSPSRLAEMDPFELFQLLVSLELSDPPSLAALDHWVMAARRVVSEVPT